MPRSQEYDTIQLDKRTNEGMDPEIERLRTEIEEVRNELSKLKSLRALSYVLIGLALLIASTAGFLLVGKFFAGAPAPAALVGPATYASAALPDTGRIEMGTVPVELNGQLFVTGVVDFSKPFSRKPLVFICEA